jgi:hypothetical protein
MRYARIFCGWSKRPKPNESRRALTRSAGSSFADFRVGLKATSEFWSTWEPLWCPDIVGVPLFL